MNAGVRFVLWLGCYFFFTWVLSQSMHFVFPDSLPQWLALTGLVLSFDVIMNYENEEHNGPS